MAALVTRWLPGLGLLVLLTGCSKNEEPASPVTPPAAVAEVAAPAGAGRTVSATLTSGQRAKLQVPFKEAVLLDPPEGEQPPYDQTLSGKSIARIYEQIAGSDSQPGLWDQTRFVDDAGRMIKYQVALQTSLGEVVIDLYPEDAPNHCRNFIALVKAGYFDGLPFYRTIQAMAETPPVAYVESGCPQGTGAVGKGHVGYWLKPEISPKLTHEAGVVGAWHREEETTAASRFYITTVAMKQLDETFTIFGKVARGLDVVRTINERPAADDRPVEPVLIQRATLLVN